MFEFEQENIVLRGPELIWHFGKLISVLRYHNVNVTQLSGSYKASISLEVQHIQFEKCPLIYRI